MEFNHSKYNNTLLKISLQSKEIENQIKDFSLEFDKYEDTFVEWQMSVPMFLPIFYEEIIVTGFVPKQLDLWELYCLKNQIEKTDPHFRGIKARFLRTYPSLVRDIHFNCFLREKSKNVEVFYNPEMDMIEGIDVLLIYKNKYFCLNLFTNTRRALVGREKKSFRHEKYGNMIQIDIPVYFETADKCGAFFLYGEKELQILKDFFLNNTVK